MSGKMWVVVMVEPALEGEYLSVTEQINEVFGPFYSEREVDLWLEQAEEKIPNRKWLIIPLSEKKGIFNG